MKIGGKCLLVWGAYLQKKLYEKYVKIHTKNTDAGEKRSLLCFKAKGCPKGHGCR